MLKRTLFSLMLVLFIGSGQLFGQDPIFSQFYANPLYLNPAFAGTARCWRVNMNYRNQWPGISGTYVTYSVSADRYFQDLSGGVGLLVTSDNAGQNTLTTTNVSGLYSYILRVSRTFNLNFGFQATYFQKSIDWNKLNFGDMIDARRGFVYDTQEKKQYDSRSNVDFSAGVLGYSDKYYVGVAVHHITQPEEGLLGNSKLPRKITAHAGITIPLGGDKTNETFISPNILFQQQQDFRQLNLGLYATKGPFVLGMWYRGQDAAILLVGLQRNQFKIGYSYDVTVSKLSNATYGSHEISISKVFECKPARKKFRMVSCPSF